MTYSIIARDPATGELGGGVQSHYFSVGSQILSAKAGAGVVATQMIVEPSYGPRGLELMQRGHRAPEALGLLVAGDPGATQRQVAMLDRGGATAAHTGPGCVAYAGHASGPDVSAQGAMLRRDDVWEAMAAAFRSTTGALAERLLSALDAAEGLGGDLRGRKSAALVVVSAEETDRPWLDRAIDLRVEDHPEPLVELRRLLSLHRLYERANRAFEAALAGNAAGALEEFGRLERERPDDPDVAFRHGLLLALSGKVEEARARLEVCYGLHEGWREVVRRLPAGGYLPNDANLLIRLGAV